MVFAWKVLHFSTFPPPNPRSRQYVDLRTDAKTSLHLREFCVQTDGPLPVTGRRGGRLNRPPGVSPGLRNRRTKWTWPKIPCARDEFSFPTLVLLSREPHFFQQVGQHGLPAWGNFWELLEVSQGGFGRHFGMIDRDRQTDRQAGRQTDRQRETDRRTDRQTDRQTARKKLYMHFR